MNYKHTLTIGILILFSGVAILGYLWSKKEVGPTPSISPTISISSNSPIPTLTPPKEVWETYTNPQLGFSIKYPQMVYGVYRCSPDKPFDVPLKVFEDNKNGIVYITEEYHYDDWDSKSQSNAGACKKIIHSLESLKEEREKYGNPFLTRVLTVKNIKSDTELNKFVKDTYGSGCFVTKKDPWEWQEGVYKIEIKGEDWDKGTDLGTTTCSINYTYKVLYMPGKNKLMSVNLGQECGFANNPASESYKCYDEEMINSFRFE